MKGFGPRKLGSIKALDVENFLKGLRADGKSDSYLAKCRGMLYQIMHKAEANDLIRKNPVRFAEKMKAQRPVQRKEAFTQDEVQKLMEDLPQDRTGHTIRLMLATGMRTQEVLALKPQHIEPDGSCIHIRQAVNMVKGRPYIGPPKSTASVRDVPVPLKAVQRQAVKSSFWYRSGTNGIGGKHEPFRVGQKARKKTSNPMI